MTVWADFFCCFVAFESDRAHADHSNSIKALYCCGCVFYFIKFATPIYDFRAKMTSNTSITEKKCCGKLEELTLNLIIVALF